MSRENIEKTTKSRGRKILNILLKYGLPLIISVGLCYYLFREMDFARMVEVIRTDCNFSLILLSMAIGILGFVVRAARWQIQLRASGVDAPLHAVTYSIVGTYAVNIVFPRLGEIWRTEYIARRQKAPFATILGSMIADRCADTLTVFLLLVATFFLAGPAVNGFIDKYPELYDSIKGVVASPYTYIIICVCVVAIWLLMRCPRGGFVGKIQNVTKSLVGGFTAIFRMKGKALWIFLALLLWFSYFAQMWIAFYAFDYTRQILETNGLIAVLVCFTLSSISMGIPSNGGFGPYQLAVIFGLECFVSSIDMVKAGAFANLVLGAQTLITIICGLITFILIALENRRRSRSEASPQNQ